MDEVTIRELRNQGREVLQRVEHGETLVITRAGVPIGEIRPLPKPRLNGRSLVTSWKDVPAIDFAEFRADIDAVLDPAL